MDEWPYWMLEENIKIVNQLYQEEDTSRKQKESEFELNKLK
jgi:hypothetical protein